MKERMNSATGMQSPAALTLTDLFVTFARIGSLAFGGGGSTLAMMHSEFCVRRPVLPDEEFQLLFGLSRMTPGMNLLSLTVLLGHRSHGALGGLAALLGLTVPSFALIILGCLLLRGSHPSPWLQGAVRGLGPAAVALLAHTFWQMGASGLRTQKPVVAGLWIGLTAAAAALTVANVVAPAWIIVGGAVLGAVGSRWLGAAAE